MSQQKKLLNVHSKMFGIKSPKEQLIVSTLPSSLANESSLFSLPHQLHLIEPVRLKEARSLKTLFLPSIEINYEIKVKSEDGILFDNDDDKGDVRVLVFGDNGSSGPIDLRANENDAKRYDGSSGTIKKKAFDAGKV